jgi:non-specific protein-tyrosine kinase
MQKPGFWKNPVSTQGEYKMKDFVELRQYVSTVLKRWWVVILALFVTVAIGYGITQRQEPVYEATASVLVGQTIQATDLSNQDFKASEELAQTYAAIARRQPVLQGTVEALGLDYRWQQLKGMVTASLVPGTQLIEITVRASSPEEAQLIADEVTQQLILISPTTLQNQEYAETAAFVRERLDNLQGKIQEGQSRLDELEVVDVSALSTAEVAELQNEINALELVIADWERSYAQLLGVIESRSASNYLAIIESAQARSTPVSPNVQLNMAVAVALGLALGLVLAFVLEHMDDTLKATDDLGQLIGVTPLGAIKEMKQKGYEKALVTSESRFAPESEAYRMIRSNIQFMSVDGPSKSILVTSAVRGEGKSIAVANLGVVMAQAGYKTVIVDTDLRRPVQHQIFGLPNSNGLIDQLRNTELDIEEHLTNTHVPGLQLLRSGSLPPNPSELLGSQRMKLLMEKLAETADLVIYDSPPAVVVADAVILSKRVDGVILVIQVEKTRRDIVRQAIFNLRQAEANVFGVILNRVSRKQHSYYYQGYYYKQHLEDTAAAAEMGRLQRWWAQMPLIGKQ